MFLAVQESSKQQITIPNSKDVNLALLVHAGKIKGETHRT